MNNLKLARKAANLTQEEVAKFIGLSQSQYSAWENGKSKIDNVSLKRLSEFLHTTTDYILGGDEPLSPSSIRIPVLGSVPAGIPIEAIENIVDYEELPAHMLTGGKEYFALQVKGDSMYPDFLQGDVVIVRKTPKCESGDVCVVYVNGYDATLKQVKLDELYQSITLVPRNEAYPPRTFTREEIENLPVSIAGVVVELRRKIK